MTAIYEQIVCYNQNVKKLKFYTEISLLFYAKGSANYESPCTFHRSY